MTGTLIAVLALWGVCVAHPSNRTSYDCLTGDACKSVNNTLRSTINDTVYCCESGDGISISYRQGFKYYSFKRPSPNDTSDDSSDSEESSESHELKFPDENDIKREYSEEVSCKCGDYKRTGNKLSKFFNRMFQQMQKVFLESFWFF